MSESGPSGSERLSKELGMRGGEAALNRRLYFRYLRWHEYNMMAAGCLSCTTPYRVKLNTMILVQQTHVHLLPRLNDREAIILTSKQSLSSKPVPIVHIAFHHV